jgi:hypothetical protein
MRWSVASAKLWSVFALWLGCEPVETTQIYLDANLVLRREVRQTTSSNGRPGRYQSDDRLLAFLEGL